MIGLWFTHGPDAPLLEQSIRVFRRTFPGGRVCISDEPTNPLPDQGRAFSPDHYEARDWPSGGNLNGWPAVFGVLDFQLRMHARFPGFPGAMKIDSDTLIFSSKWLSVSSAVTGFDFGSIGHLLGAARWLREDAARVIVSDLSGKYRNTQVAPAEDATISIHAFRRFGDSCLVHDWGEAGGIIACKPPHDFHQGHRTANVVIFTGKGPETAAAMAELIRLRTP